MKEIIEEYQSIIDHLKRFGMSVNYANLTVLTEPEIEKTIDKLDTSDYNYTAGYYGLKRYSFLDLPKMNPWEYLEKILGKIKKTSQDINNFSGTLTFKGENVSKSLSESLNECLAVIEEWPGVEEIRKDFYNKTNQLKGKKNDNRRNQKN